MLMQMLLAAEGRERRPGVLTLKDRADTALVTV